MKIRIIPMGTSKDNRTQMQKELCRKFCNPSGAIFVQQRPTTGPMRSSMNGYMPHQMDIPNHTDELAALIRFLTGDVYEPTQSNMDKETNVSSAKPHNTWKPAEDAILQSFYPEEGLRVARRLEGRSTREILDRAGELGLLKNPENFGWTKEEDDFIRNYFFSKTTPETKGPAEIPPERFDEWEEWEDELIRKIYPSEGQNMCLPNRTSAEPMWRAYKLNVKYLDRVEDEPTPHMMRKSYIFTTLDGNIFVITKFSPDPNMA